MPLFNPAQATGWAVIEVIDASAAASVDFTGISDTYAALKLTGSCIGSASSALGMRFNGDSGSNYDRQGQQANGVATSQFQSIAASLVYASSLSTSWPSAFEVQVTNANSTSGDKAGIVHRSLKSSEAAGGLFDVTEAIFWRNDTDAIDQITLTPDSGTVTGRFILLGLAA